jgi:hypothetical protein
VPWQRLQKLLAKVKESTIIHNVSIFNKYSWAYNIINKLYSMIIV